MPTFSLRTGTFINSVKRFTLLIGLLLSVYAYKAQPNYKPYMYDLGHTMFTPDGRLLQVEYATTAATSFSAPICIVRLQDDLILMACPIKKTAEGTVSVMDRLIVLPNAVVSTSEHRNKPGNIDKENAAIIVVAVAGVLADGLALLQKLQGDLLNDDHYFGGKHQWTPSYVASKLADYAYENCVFGGIRPYGAMVWTLGFAISSAGTGHFEIFQTSPSGAMVQLHLPEDDSIPLILGGGGKEGQELVRELKKILSRGKPKNNANNNTTVVSSTIGRIAKLLSSDNAEPEILLLSLSRGALKLNQEQILSFVKQLG